MGLGIKVIHLALELHKKDYFKNSRSVIDMGDQDLHIDFGSIRNEIDFLKKEELEKKFNRAKYFPERPRVSSSTLWNILGFEKCDRLDIEKLPRSNEDICDNFLKIDLNYPIEDQTEFEKYDLVTDLGNNEHPFNTVESYKTMHKLCEKDGYMLIHQNIFGGNGFYNFDISFFESMAAVNNYTILYSCYTFDVKDKYFSLPIDEDLIKCINLNTTKDIGIFYLFKKNNNENFVLPYQGSGSSIKRKEIFSNNISKFNSMPSRTYLPMNIDQLSKMELLKLLFKKMKVIK